MSVPKHPSRNFGELFWRAALLYPNKIAIRQGDAALTYAVLEDRTQRVAALLQRLGIARGDKALLLMQTIIGLWSACWGRYGWAQWQCL